MALEIPTGDIITVEVGKNLVVSAPDYDWNHCLFFWACSRRDLAEIIVARLRGENMPERLAYLFTDEAMLSRNPDLGKEIVSFTVNGTDYPFSIFSMTITSLTWS
jgi:hypothetical protein